MKTFLSKKIVGSIVFYVSFLTTLLFPQLIGLSVRTISLVLHLENDFFGRIP